MPVRMQMRVCRPAYTACDLFIKPDCLKEKKHPSLVFFCFHHLFIIYLHRSHSAFAFHINSSLAFTLPHKYFFPSIHLLSSVCHISLLSGTPLSPWFKRHSWTSSAPQGLYPVYPFPFAPSANSIPHLSAQTSWWEYLAALLTIECSNSLSLTHVQTAGG